MSEPTPLNAEELAAVRGWKPLTGGEYVEAVRWWLSMSSYRKGKHSRYLATIDAQATEIAGLRGALEREKRSEWREGLVAVIDHEGNYLGCMGTMTWAVLAGKGAQG